MQKSAAGRSCPLRRDVIRVTRYLLAGAVSAGGLAALFISGLAGAGRAGAAPVVMPGWSLGRGVTSRMPGGAAGGFAGWVWAVCEGGVVPAWLMVVLLRP